MEQSIIVLYARPWSLIDEKTKQPKSGISVQYIASDSLRPAVNSLTGEVGYVVCKESVPTDLLSKIQIVPAVYTAKFVMRAKQGKNVLSLSDLNYLSEI